MKRAGFITKILVFAVIAFLAWKIIDYRGAILDAGAHKDELESRTATLELQNDEMRRRIAGADDDAIIEEIAREQLDLVMPGEEIIYN
jgi:cell division protein FtsB